MSVTFLTDKDLEPLEGRVQKLEDTGQNGLTAEQISALDGMFKICAYTQNANEAYTHFKTAFGITDPDGPGDDTKTLTDITVVYSGGNVTAGTDVNELSGIVVTAHYDDGSTEVVTDYTLSGTIAEGSNVVTVNYGGMTATFEVVGTHELTDEYTLYMDVDVSKFLNGYGHTIYPDRSSIPYAMEKTERTAYCDFDIPASDGETYKFEWELEPESDAADISTVFYNANFMSCVDQHITAIESDIDDQGWYSNGSPYVISPIKPNIRTMRMVFKSGTVKIKRMTIYRKKAS